MTAVPGREGQAGEEFQRNSSTCDRSSDLEEERVKKPGSISSMPVFYFL
jgi:hypothetical protein